MLKSIEKALKLSEIREKLNDLNAVTDPTAEQKTEERDLLASLKTTEVEYRESLTAEDDTTPTVPVDAAETEYREILGRGNVGRIMTAFIESRSVDGAEAEVQQHRGLASNQIPLDLLRLPAVERAPLRPDRRPSPRPSNRPSCRYSRRASGRSWALIVRRSTRARSPIRFWISGPTWAGRTRTVQALTKRRDRFRRRCDAGARAGEFFLQTNRRGAIRFA